jgi:hypothetical protein
MNQKSPRQIKRFASAIYKGHSLQCAMLEAGYSPSTARRGRAALSKPMLEALAREWNKLELLGRRIGPEQQENLVRGRLVQNVITGRDDAVQSARQLGADKRITMWQADSQVGLVVIKAPEPPKLERPIRLKEAEFKDEDGI